MALRKKVGKMAMNQVLRRQTAPQQSIAYEDAKRICLLIPLYGSTDMQWIGDLLNRLTQDGKDCFILGFSELSVDTFQNPQVVILEPKALCWHLIPKENTIKSFISTNFDLLLNLCTDDSHLALDYAALRIAATLRIGRYEPMLAKAYGLMVKGEFTDSKALLNTIKHYLSKIQ